MGERAQRQRNSRLGISLKHSSWVLLTVQYTAFVLSVHYSRIMSPAGGKRYLTSTAVFLNEVMKLALSLTMALYEVSKAAPASMPATSLLFSLLSTVFSGDSWKLAIPASLYTLANSLQYIGLSNLQASTFQVTYQLKLLVSAIFGIIVLRRSVPPRKWAILLLLLVGVAFVQISDSSRSEGMSPQDEGTHLSFPRTLEEWKVIKGAAGKLRKRSATYEGIEEDMMTIFPQLNSMVGLLATIGACAASALAGVYFEKVLKDSPAPTSLWVRNVQLAIYSIFPALFIGVVSLDGEKIGTDGFFQGYNWAVWLSIAVQAIGGVAAAFCVGNASKGLATATSIVLSTLGSMWLFEFKLTSDFLLGTAAVLIATCLYGNPSSGPSQGRFPARPPPIRVNAYEKDAKGEQTSPVVSPANDFSMKLPSTPFLADAGLSTSRPTSPSHARTSSGRSASGGGYFPKQS